MSNSLFIKHNEYKVIKEIPHNTHKIMFEYIFK